MNQLHHYLLMLIDRMIIDVEEYIPFDKIIAELVPMYQQENMLLDPVQIITVLGEMVDYIIHKIRAPREVIESKYPKA